MNNIEYLIKELGAVVNDLHEDIMGDDSIVSRAYKQGKKDAYAFVLQALEDGLKEERKEIEEQKKKYDEFMNSIEKRGKV